MTPEAAPSILSRSITISMVCCGFGRAWAAGRSCTRAVDAKPHEALRAQLVVSSAALSPDDERGDDHHRVPSAKPPRGPPSALCAEHHVVVGRYGSPTRAKRM
jgi:hypothetical protein